MKEVIVAHPPRVTIKRAAELLGYTVKAIEQKVDKGVWPEGKVWLRALTGAGTSSSKPTTAGRAGRCSNGASRPRR